MFQLKLDGAAPVRDGTRSEPISGQSPSLPRSRAPTRPYLGLVVGGFLCVALYGAVTLHTQRKAQDGLVLEELAQLGDRLAALEDRTAQGIPSSEAKGRTSDAEAQTLSRQLDDLRSRLDLLEQHIAAIDPTASSEPQAREADGVSTAERLTSKIEQQLQARPTGPSFEETYSQEAGQSEWGAAAAANVTRAFADSQFFSQYGGNLRVDCRTTTCEMVWSLPDQETLSPGQYDDLSVLAGYELMAVAAKSGQQPVALQPVYELSGKNPHISMYVERPPEK